MGGDQNPLALLDLGDDLVVPEGQSAGDGVLEALTGGELVLRQVTVATILQCSQCTLTLCGHFFASTFLLLFVIWDTRTHARTHARTHTRLERLMRCLCA